MKDLYAIIGTERNCTPADLNTAYRKLAQKLQPDDEAWHDPFLNSRFHEITEAYEILSDPVRRRKYDTAFKKHYQRRLYYFKIKHINIATAFTLIVFTSLFGYYVLRMLKGHDRAKKTVLIQTPPLAKIKYHKKKKGLKPAHSAHTIAAAAPAQPRFVRLNSDTLVSKPDKPATAKTLIPANNMPVIADEPVKIVPPAVQNLASIRTVGQNVNQGYTTYLQANITGLVSVHQAANYASSVVTTIPNHTPVTVLERGQSFYKIAFGSQTGYVSKRNIATP